MLQGIEVAEVVQLVVKGMGRWNELMAVGCVDIIGNGFANDSSHAKFVIVVEPKSVQEP